MWKLWTSLPSSRVLKWALRSAASDRFLGAHPLHGETGAEDIDTIECSFGCDLVRVDFEVKAGRFDDELEVLGDLVLIDDLAPSR